MVATWRLYAHLVGEIPLLLVYLRIIVACMGSDASGMMDTSFYSFIMFNGILDIEDAWKLTFIYSFTWLVCCTREFSSLAFALNRFTSIIYNNKKWSGRSFLLTVLLCLIIGYSTNYYMWDTDAQYQKIPMGDGTSIYFMLMDDMKREWLNEAAVTLSWASFTYILSMAIYILIAFHVLFGGAHPEVDRREFRLTMIAFLFQICDTAFYINQVMSYLIDRDDIIEALKAVRDGGPLIPFCHDMRMLCVPLFLFLFDSVIRGKVLGTCGMGGSSAS